MRRPTERTYRSKRIGWWLPAGAQTSQSVSPSSMSAACRRPWPPCSATSCLQTEQRSCFASMRSPLMDILSPIGAVRTNPHCLTAGIWVGARNRSYAGCRLPTQRRACGVCTILEGDDPPPSSRSERISLDYATGNRAFEAGSTALSVRLGLYRAPDRVSQPKRNERRFSRGPDRGFLLANRIATWRNRLDCAGGQSNQSGG